MSSEPVPFFSFAAMHAALGDAPHEAFRRFWDKQYYILGESVSNFERAYAQWNDVKYCVGVANGLDALHLSLRALGIGPGDEVIVPSNTYIASWLAVSQAGARPIPVEPDAQTCNIDPARIAEAVTSRTKAVMPVHLYGQACDMTAIGRVAAQYGLYIVEDNAQAHGARHAGRLAGSFGAVNAVSFYPTKNLGALGDAGAITTDNETWAHAARRLRNYGSVQKYYNEIAGYNSRLDELQAALLSLKLPLLDGWTLQRRRIAEQYAERLSGIDELTLPFAADPEAHVWHLYVVRTPRRAALQAALNAAGIGWMVHYPIPPHLQEAYRDLGYQRGDFPLAEAIADTCLSLPLYPGMSEAQVERVCAVVRSIF